MLMPFAVYRYLLHPNDDPLSLQDSVVQGSGILNVHVLH